MKTLLVILTTALAVVSAQAESDLIKIGAKVQEGEDILTTPSVIVSPGKNAQITVAKDFIQDANLDLPVGVVLDATANFKEDKISYSILLTLREHVQSEGPATVKAVSTFKTRELMLSGIATPGDKVEAVLDKQTTLVITLEKTSFDGKVAILKSDKSVEPTS